MKKALISLLLIISLVLTPVTMVSAAKKKSTKTTTTTEKAPDKVTIHLFYASWCSHCHDFIEYFSDKYEQYADQFEIKGYMVSDISADGQSSVSIPENSEIMDAVSTYFKTDNSGEDLQGGIPLIIIGDSFVQSGFGTDGTDIINAALEELKNTKYVDRVAKIISDNNYDTSKVETFKEVVDRVLTEPSTDETAGKYDTIIIVSIFAVLLVGIGSLVLVGRKEK